jgi:hypothetical protein
MTVKLSVSKRGRRLWRAGAMILFAALGWCAVWWGAVLTTRAQVDAWIGHELSLGRQWTCQRRDFNGFPFQIALTCEAPYFVGTVNGRELQGGLSVLHATAELYRPGHLLIDARSPLKLRAAQGGDWAIGWERMQASVVGTPSHLQQLSVSAVRVDAEALPPIFGETTANAGRVQIELSLAPRANETAHDYRVSLNLDAAVIPVFDTATESNSPVNAVVTGTLSQAEWNSAGTAVERLEHWRRAGGRFDIASLILDKGRLHVSAHGQIYLDEQHRLSGQIEAAVEGIEPLLAHFGVPITAVQFDKLGGLLGRVLGAKNRAPNEPKKLPLKLTLAGGRLMLGPIPTLVLEPLY